MSCQRGHMDELVTMLRAAGDPTRLRLFLLLRQAELTVSELVEIVGQSQPRVSRHLKLLTEAHLIERFKEGSWVFYRAADRGQGVELGSAIARHIAAQPIDSLLDAGTGTGSMLELLAPHVKRAVGIDVSPEMLAI